MCVCVCLRTQVRLSFSRLSGTVELYYYAQATSKCAKEIQYERPTSSCVHFIFLFNNIIRISVWTAKNKNGMNGVGVTIFVKSQQKWTRLLSAPHIYLCIYYARKYIIRCPFDIEYSFHCVCSTCTHTTPIFLFMRSHCNGICAAVCCSLLQPMVSASNLPRI